MSKWNSLFFSLFLLILNALKGGNYFAHLMNIAHFLSPNNKKGRKKLFQKIRTAVWRGFVSKEIYYHIANIDSLALLEHWGGWRREARKLGFRNNIGEYCDAMHIKIAKATKIPDDYKMLRFFLPTKILLFELVGANDFFFQLAPSLLPTRYYMPNCSNMEQ